jgi:hypothetical protein
MTTVLKPLGEALTLMSAGERYESQTAAPGFTVVRHVALPVEARPAVLAAEHAGELSEPLVVLPATRGHQGDVRSTVRAERLSIHRYRQLHEEILRRQLVGAHQSALRAFQCLQQ